MQDAASRRLVRALLERHGRTFAEEAGIAVEANTPPALYQLLCASLLFSARISARIALRAFGALMAEGWTTPERLAATTWEERVRVLNASGYARYDESTSRMLGDTTTLLLQRYQGDLRRLRDAARRDPQREKRLLQEFKGIGELGADIFLREAQVAWEELYPYADARVLEGARALGLPQNVRELAALVERDDFPRLAAALVRLRLEGDEQEVIEAAQTHDVQ